jgi:alanine dehydrogenase
MTAARRSISPGIVFLAVALIGSLLFALYAVTVRDADQIPLLAAGSAVLGIVFIALAAYALRAIWRAGIEGRSGRALLLGVGGGIAVIIGAGCVAAAIILFLLARPLTT